MKKLLLLLSICIATALAAQAQNNIVYNAVPITYKTYCNKKFDFCVKYPDSFTSEGENEGGDGQLFECVDGTTLEAVATPNTEKLTVKKAYADAMKAVATAENDGSTVVFDLLDKDRYIVISKDEIELIARLAVLTGETWKTVIITIPKKRETYYKDKVDEIFKSFNAYSSTGLSKMENSARK